jgi:hypothetical protein
MAVDAELLASAVSVEVRVLAAQHHGQMRDLHAQAVPAGVVNDLALRQRTMRLHPHDAMNELKWGGSAANHAVTRRVPTASPEEAPVLSLTPGEDIRQES